MKDKQRVEVKLNLENDLSSGVHSFFILHSFFFDRILFLQLLFLFLQKVTQICMSNLKIKPRMSTDQRHVSPCGTKWLLALLTDASGIENEQSKGLERPTLDHAGHQNSNQEPLRAKFSASIIRDIGQRWRRPTSDADDCRILELIQDVQAQRGSSLSP